MPNQTEALIQRLEKLGQNSVGNYGMPICAEAAGELRRLVAENALLHERHHFDNGVLKELLEALKHAHTWLQGSEPGRAQYLGEIIAKAEGQK
jgi:hypothetical protein